MEIKIDLDLPAIIGNAVSAEKIQPLVDKAITAAIKDAVDSATGYRSPFREALQKQLAEALPHGLDMDDRAKFQHMLNQAVNSAVHGANAETIRAAMEAMMKKVLPDVPHVLKLSEFMAIARNGFHKDRHEAFYAELEMSDYGGGWLYLDEDENTREKYRADHCIAFNKEGQVYSVKLDGNQIMPTSLPSVVGSFDAVLLSMYTGRTSLEIDMNEADVEYAACSEEH